MFTRLKRISSIIALVISIGFFSVASVAADSHENVTVTVQDKNGLTLPFASVEFKKRGFKELALTGADGSPAEISIESGSYNLAAGHPLVEKSNGQPAMGKAKIKLNRKRTHAAITVTLKGVFQDDLTPPVIGNVQPTDAFTYETGKPINLSIEAKDDKSDIALVTASLNGQDVGQYNSREGDLFRWALPALPEGRYTVAFNVWNYAGKQTPKTVTFNVRQPVGTINGQVDFAGQPVTDASIQLTDTLRTVTNANGSFNFTSVPTGSYTAAISANGLTSQSLPVTVKTGETVSLNVTLLDTVAPAVPANVQVKRDKPTASKQIVSWSAVTDRSGISYEIERYEQATKEETKSTASPEVTFENLKANTEYTYKVRAKDGATTPNFSPWATVTGTTQIRPMINWRNPLPGTELAGTVNLNVAYFTLSQDNPIVKIDWILVATNQNIGTTSPNSASGESQISWNTTTIANGSYEISALVKDAEDNTRSANLSVTVKNTQAVQQGTVIGKVTLNGNPVVNATVTDVTVSSDSTINSTTNQSGEFRLAAVPAGARTIRVISAGLVEQSKTVTVVHESTATVDFAMVDLAPPVAPTLTGARNINPTATTQNVTWSGVSDASGIKHYIVERLLNGNTQESKTTSNTTADFTDLSPDTNYTYKVKAVDNADNIGSWSNTMLVRTQKLPALGWTNPLNGQALEGIVNLTVVYEAMTSSVANASITLWPDNKTLVSFPRQTASGQLSHSFDTAGLSGQKTLRASLTDSEGNNVTVDVTVTIKAAALNGIITGVVTEIGGGAVADMPLELRRASEVVAAGKTNAAGQYRLENIAPDTYQLFLSDEGYEDKTVANVVVGDGQTLTTNVALTSLPRVNLRGVVRELPGPGGVKFDLNSSPAGISIEPNSNRLVVLTGGRHVHWYNIDTESFIATKRDAASGSLFMVHDSNSLFFASYGNSYWTDFKGDNLVRGEELGYESIAADPYTNTIYVYTPDRIYRIVNRVRQPRVGYNVNPLIGGISRYIGVGKNSLYSLDYDQTVYRLSKSNPTDSNYVLKRPLSFDASRLHAIKNTRTIAILDSPVSTNARVHLYDARTLEEYAVIEVTGLGFERSSPAASLISSNENGKIKLLISDLRDNRVLIVE